MQRFTLIASVGDLGILSGLATSRSRLMVAAVASTVAVVGYGLAIQDFVTNRSASISLNVVLVTMQFFLIFAAAYVQAMFVGASVFGDDWRRRVLAGERVSGDDSTEIEIQSLKDRSLQFYGIFALAIAFSYGAVVTATGNFVRDYNETGYYLTLFRSDDPELRVRAVRSLVDPLHEASASSRRVRERLAEAVVDESPEVAAWAAWACGHLQVQEATPDLLRLLQHGERDARIEAALALGRIRDPEAERRLLALLPSVQDDPEFARAIVTALGLMPSTTAVPTLVGLLGVGDETFDAAALWAIGRSRRTDVRQAIVDGWRSSEGALRCAYAEALKHATTVEDYDAMRQAFRDDEAMDCATVEFDGRQYDPEHPLPSVQYVIGEELRLKYLKAAFNIGGPGLEEWLRDVAWDDTESVPMRNQADDLAEALRVSPARLPRE